MGFFVGPIEVMQAHATMAAADNARRRQENRLKAVQRFLIVSWAVLATSGVALVVVASYFGSRSWTDVMLIVGSSLAAFSVANVLQYGFIVAMQNRLLREMETDYKDLIKPPGMLDPSALEQDGIPQQAVASDGVSYRR